MTWKFIKPNKNLSIEEKISYVEGSFTMLSQIHDNLQIGGCDEEFNSLNIEIKEYRRNLQEQLNKKNEIKRQIG